MQNGIYNALYEMIANAIYGGLSSLTGWQELTLTFIATCACLFVLVVPFLIVWKVIKTICGG